MNINLNFLNNQYVVVLTALFLGLYGYTLSRVELPDYIRNLFNNAIFRVVFLSLMLVYNFNSAPHVAIAIALIFVLTMQKISEQETKENFAFLESFQSHLRM